LNRDVQPCRRCGEPTPQQLAVLDELAAATVDDGKLARIREFCDRADLRVSAQVASDSYLRGY
jgi:hypothetical protein